MRVCKEENRCINKTEVSQEAVNPSVLVITKELLENNVCICRNGRCIKEEYNKGTYPFWKLVNQPGKKEGHDVADWSCDYGNKKGILNGRCKNFILKKKIQIVCSSDKVRFFQNIIVCKTKINGSNHWQYIKSNKKHCIRQKEKVAEFMCFDIVNKG